jgi:hypothetical protein
MTHEQQMEVGRQIDVANRAPQTHDEAVALGVWLRSQPEPKAEKLRAPRPEDGQMVFVPDVIGEYGGTMKLFCRSVAGLIENEVPAFPDLGQLARGLQRQALNRLHAGNSNALAGSPNFKPVVAPPLEQFVVTASYNQPVDLGALKDWIAFHHHQLAA